MSLRHFFIKWASSSVHISDSIQTEMENVENVFSFCNYNENWTFNIKNQNDEYQVNSRLSEVWFK